MGGLQSFDAIMRNFLFIEMKSMANNLFCFDTSNFYLSLNELVA